MPTETAVFTFKVPGIWNMEFLPIPKEIRGRIKIVAAVKNPAYLGKYGQNALKIFGRAIHPKTGDIILAFGLVEEDRPTYAACISCFDIPESAVSFLQSGM